MSYESADLAQTHSRKLSAQAGLALAGLTDGANADKFSEVTDALAAAKDRLDELCWRLTDAQTNTQPNKRPNATQDLQE